jgi:hypothetical protein
LIIPAITPETAFWKPKAVATTKPEVKPEPVAPEKPKPEAVPAEKPKKKKVAKKKAETPAPAPVAVVEPAKPVEPEKPAIAEVPAAPAPATPEPSPVTPAPEPTPAPAPVAAVEPAKPVEPEKPAVAPTPAPEPVPATPVEPPKPPAPAPPKKPELTYETFQGKALPTPKDPNLALDPKFRVIKVHAVENDGRVKNLGNNKALEFELQYWNYGAVTEAEKKARLGNYYVITWANEATPGDLVARFEYRQAKSKDVTRALTLAYPQAKGSNRSVFTVVGEAYRVYGPVTAWRFTLLRGDKVVAEEKSFVW